MNHQMLPGWLEISSAVLLTVLLLYVLTKNQIVSSAHKKENFIVKDTDKQTDLIVPGMTCNNCVNNVKISHKNNITKNQIVLAVENSGYQVSNK